MKPISFIVIGTAQAASLALLSCWCGALGYGACSIIAAVAAAPIAFTVICVAIDWMQNGGDDE